MKLHESRFLKSRIPALSRMRDLYRGERRWGHELEIYMDPSPRQKTPGIRDFRKNFCLALFQHLSRVDMKLASDREPADPNPVVSTQALRLKPRPLTTRRVLSLTLLIAGIGLLAYVAAQYADMFRTQQSLETQWQRQASALAATKRPLVAGTLVLTRLQIPRIKLDAIVLEGVTSQQLSKGPGHIEETAVPGETGNAVITAHRDTFFRYIFELDKGDEIRVLRGGQLFRFQVSGKAIVEPDDVSVIQPTPDPQLTLITCYPTYYIGPAPQRLVVFSKLVP